jgi:hypothetical protein
MSITNTTSFSYNAQQIIQFAMRKCGVLEPGATYDANIYQNFQDSLNLILKSWITKGTKIYTIQTLAIPLQANINKYVLGLSTSGPQAPIQAYNLSSATPTTLTYVDKPMRLLQAYLRNVQTTPNQDTPLQIISQHDYTEFGSKLSTGIPNSVFLEVLRDQSHLKMYTTPDSVAASTYQVYILTQRLIYDINTTTDNLDVPAETYYALGWNLARDQILDCGVDQVRASLILQESTKYLTEVEDWGVEATSTYFTSDTARYGKR